MVNGLTRKGGGGDKDSNGCLLNVLLHVSAHSTFTHPTVKFHLLPVLYASQVKRIKRTTIFKGVHYCAGTFSSLK